MKKMCRLFLLLFLSNFYLLCYAQKTMNIDNGKLLEGDCSSIPTRDVTNLSDGVLVEYNIENLLITKDDLYESAFLVKIKGFGQNENIEEPNIPIRWDTFAIPDGCSARIELIDSSFVDYNLELAPARPFMKDDGVLYYTKDVVKPISNYSGYFPSHFAERSSSFVYRSNNLLKVKVSPVSYNMRDKTIRVFKSLAYKVVFVENAGLKSKQEKKYSKLAFDDSFVLNNTLNGAFDREKRVLSKIPSTNLVSIQNQKDYLIVSVEKYHEAVEKFAEWKRMMGFNVKIAMKDAWQDTTEVWNTIHDEYLNSEGKLYYLSIIGDIEDVPAFHPTICYQYAFDGQQSTDTHYSDLFYGIMSNHDNMVTDIRRGRLSVSSAVEAMDVVEKIINYEKNPPMFVKKGVNCSLFQSLSNRIGMEDNRATFTNENIRNALVREEGMEIERTYNANARYSPSFWNNVYANGLELPDSVKNINWNGNTSDIIQSLNDGVSYALYIGHSNYNGWERPAFHNTDISQLSIRDDNAFPIFFSMGCLSGKFDETICFAEALLRNKNRGGIAVFANTNISWFGYAEALAEGMFFSIWPETNLVPVFPSLETPSYPILPEPTYRLGDIMDQGMMRVGDTFGNQFYSQQIMHCFGDPSMFFNTEIPVDFQDIAVKCYRDSLVVEIPNEKGIITFLNQATKNVTSFYGNYGRLDNPSEDIIICISGHNRIPRIITMRDLTCYIQNEILSGTNNYDVFYVKIGSSVTDKKPSGPVLIVNGRTTIRAKEAIIESDTEVAVGAEIEILTQ